MTQRTPPIPPRCPSRNSLAELENIVAQLERGDVPLADSIRIYKRGAAFKARCEGQLKDAQLEVDQIVMGPMGPEPSPRRSGNSGERNAMADDPQANARLPIISFDDFLKVDIRLGTIIEVKMFEDAKKAAYQLWIDFGDPLGVKKSSRAGHAELRSRRTASAGASPRW